MRWTTRCVFAALGVFLCAIPAAAQSHTVTVVRDIDYVAGVEYPDGKDRLDLYIPRDARNAPVIFSLHGGALEIGDRREETFRRPAVRRRGISDRRDQLSSVAAGVTPRTHSGRRGRLRMGQTQYQGARRRP